MELRALLGAGEVLQRGLGVALSHQVLGKEPGHADREELTPGLHPPR